MVEVKLALVEDRQALVEDPPALVENIPVLVEDRSALDEDWMKTSVSVESETRHTHELLRVTFSES